MKYDNSRNKYSEILIQFWSIVIALLELRKKLLDEAHCEPAGEDNPFHQVKSKIFTRSFVLNVAPNLTLKDQLRLSMFAAGVHKRS